MSHEHHEGCSCAHPTDDTAVMIGQAQNLTHLAQHWLTRSRPDLAAPFVDLAQTLLHKAQATNSEQQFWLITVKVGLAQARDAKATAVRHARAGLALARRLVEDADPISAIACANLGEVLLEIDNPPQEEARELINRAIAIFSDPSTVSEKYNAGYLNAGAAHFRELLQSLPPQ